MGSGVSGGGYRQSRGSPDEAIANLKEATEFYLEEFPTSVETGRWLITTFEAPYG